MMKQNQHSSVAEMARDLSEDAGFVNELERRLSGRRLIKLLAILRARADMSQQGLAEKLGCTQSKVSKLESSADADVRFGDLVDYTGAVGHEMRIFLVPQSLTLVDEVKMHAFTIKRLLDDMVKLAGGDNVMTQGMAKFLKEAAFNLIGIVRTASQTLPVQPKGPSRPIQVEAPEVEDDSTRARGAKSEANENSATLARC